MEDNQPVPSLPPSTIQNNGDEGKDDQQSKAPIALIIVGIVILVLLIAAAVLLIRADNDTTGRVRDVFIIFMALESLVLGVGLIILIVQLATLINLLQNEIKPILESTNETVSTLRGTTNFLSDHLAEPVIKLNEYLAGMQQFFKLLSLGRGKPRKDKSQGE